MLRPLASHAAPLAGGQRILLSEQRTVYAIYAIVQILIFNNSDEAGPMLMGGNTGADRDCTQNLR
jgi:hypothetical protein